MNVFISKASLKYLARCEKKMKLAIMDAIEHLADAGDIRKLKGQSIRNAFRLRVGRYRVVFTKEENEIRVLDIDTRGDIYKRS